MTKAELERTIIEADANIRNLQRLGLARYLFYPSGELVRQVQRKWDAKIYLTLFSELTQTSLSEGEIQKGE